MAAIPGAALVGERAANASDEPDPQSPPVWMLERKAIEPALERIGLELWLTKTREYLTVDHPAVRRMLAGAPLRLSISCLT